MRVVHVCAYFAPAFAYGGPPRSLLRLAQAQQRQGLSVQVVTTTANGRVNLDAAAAAADRFEGVPVTYCRRARPRWLFHAPALRGALSRALNGADILHIHGLWNAAVWGAHAVAAGRRVRYVLSPRGMLAPQALAHDRWRKAAAYQLFDRRVLRDATVLHATSEQERDTLVQRCGRERVVMVPNGVDLPPAAAGVPAVRARFGLPPHAPLILFLGRIHPLKRLDLLAGAFLALHAAQPQAHLVVAGPDETGLRAGLEQQLAPVAGAVTWTGRVDEAEKWALLAEAAVLVLCSDSESFGLSVAEALAAARPVVVTRTCPWSSVAASGAGFWVEQRAEAIAAAIGRVLADPAAAQEMGERGRRLIAADYSWDSAARRLTTAYETALAAA